MVWASCASAASPSDVVACALDQAALRCKAKPSCNAAGGKTIDVQVAKAINDNLKGWGAMELDGSRDADGLTCRQRIKARKELNTQNPGNTLWGRSSTTSSVLLSLHPTVPE